VFGARVSFVKEQPKEGKSRRKRRLGREGINRIVEGYRSGVRRSKGRTDGLPHKPSKSENGRGKKRTLAKGMNMDKVTVLPEGKPNGSRKEEEDRGGRKTEAVLFKQREGIDWEKAPESEEESREQRRGVTGGRRWRDTNRAFSVVAGDKTTGLKVFSESVKGKRGVHRERAGKRRVPRLGGKRDPPKEGSRVFLGRQGYQSGGGYRKGNGGGV